MRIEILKEDDAERLKRRRWVFYFYTSGNTPILSLKSYAVQTRQTRRHGWRTTGDWWASCSMEHPGKGRWDRDQMDDDPELPDWVVAEAKRQVAEGTDLKIHRSYR